MYAVTDHLLAVEVVFRDSRWDELSSVRVRTLSSPIRHLSSRRLDWPVSTESMLGVTNLLDPWRDRCLHILVAGAAASVAVLLLPLPT